MHGADVTFTAVGSDSRGLGGGELFVALKGPNFDGHDFIGAAEAAGAVAAMLSRSVETALPYVEVADTRMGLGRLAADWRSQFAIPLVAVTGSNGKTTVKEMIAAILNEMGPGLVTEGNLNNDIGVPLTLLRMRARDRYAVIEMGMNHAGEIDYLSRLAYPTVALITNAAEAHIEGLGSVTAVARAKGEIFSGLASDGVAVLNADDAHIALWREMAAPRRSISFGLTRKADVRGEYAGNPEGSQIFIKTPEGGIDMKLPLLGRHNVMNALAATTAAMQVGASRKNVKTGMEKLRAMAGRLEIRKGFHGARVLDDTYNANPASVAAGLDVLRAYPGETVLVLGDMAELGKAAPAIHRRVGELAKRLGINRLFALGKLGDAAAEGFGSGGEHHAEYRMLTGALRGCMHAEMTILVKGSRAAHMERIIAGICDEQTPPAAARPALAAARENR